MIATPKDDPAEISWHFDRRIPLALIATLVLQTGAAIWWASSVNSFMAKSSEQTTTLNERVAAVEGASSDVNLRLVRFEVMLENVTNQIKEQKAMLTEIRDSVSGGGR